MSLLSYRGAGTLGHNGGVSPGGPTIPTRWSQDVPNSWGVNLHIPKANTAYATTNTQLVNALNFIGVTMVRDVLHIANKTQQTTMAALNAGAKVRVLFCANDMRSGSPPPAGSAIATEILTNYGTSVVIGVTGTNEPDNSGYTTSPGQVSLTVTLQGQLWASSLNGVMPIFGPPLGNPNSTYTAYGDLSAVCDAGDLHTYTGGGKPSTAITKHITTSAAMYGTGKARWHTEGGYHNAYKAALTFPGVPENVSGAYYPILVLTMLYLNQFTGTWNWPGVPSSAFFAYELVDEKPDAGMTVEQSHFGLFHNDWTPKAAAVAVGRLMALLNDPGGAYTPTDMQGKVTGGTSDLRYMNFQNRAGTNFLCLWRDVSTYTQSTSGPGTAVTVTPYTVTLTLPNSASVLHYDVAANTANGSTVPVPVGQPTTGLTHAVSLAGNLIVLQV